MMDIIREYARKSVIMADASIMERSGVPMITEINAINLMSPVFAMVMMRSAT